MEGFLSAVSVVICARPTAIMVLIEYVFIEAHDDIGSARGKFRPNIDFKVLGLTWCWGNDFATRIKPFCAQCKHRFEYPIISVGMINHHRFKCTDIHLTHVLLH